MKTRKILFSALALVLLVAFMATPVFAEKADGAITGVSIAGTATVGQELTATAAGTPTGTVTYAWYREAKGDITDATKVTTAISGATSATYTLVSADVGNYVYAKATDPGTDGGTAKSFIAKTAVVTPLKTAAEAVKTMKIGEGDDFATDAVKTEGVIAKTGALKLSDIKVELEDDWTAQFSVQTGTAAAKVIAADKIATTTAKIGDKITIVMKAKGPASTAAETPKYLITVAAKELTAVADAALDIANEQITATALSSGTDLYYRVTKAAGAAFAEADKPKAGKWVKAALPLDISKLIGKNPIIIEIVTGTATALPGNDDVATTVFYVMGRPDKIKEKIAIKATGGIEDTVSGGQVAVLEGTTALVQEYKYFTDVAWAPVTATDKYPLGFTAAELWFRQAVVTKKSDETPLTGLTAALAPTPGGPVTKVKLPTAAKDPTVKVDYVKGVVKGSDKWQIYDNANDKWVDMAKADYTFGATENLTNKVLAYNVGYQVRVKAAGAKPASLEAFFIADQIDPAPEETDFAVIGGKLYSKTGYFLTEYKEGTAWKKGLPKLEKDGSLKTNTEIRWQGNAVYRVVASESMKLTWDTTNKVLKFGEDAPAEQGGGGSDD